MMTAPVIQLIVLAAIALFLVFKLRDILGTREGFEPEAPPAPIVHDTPTPEVEDGDDFTDHLPDGHAALPALAQMRAAEADFALTPFLNGAKSAHEMILTAFETGDLDPVRPFISDEVAAAFDAAIGARAGARTDFTYAGTRETALQSAGFDPDTGLAELTVRFISEVIVARYDADGNLIEGNAKTPRKQRDHWTFARRMGQNDPNWQLVATG